MSVVFTAHLDSKDSDRVGRAVMKFAQDHDLSTSDALRWLALRGVGASPAEARAANALMLAKRKKVAHVTGRDLKELLPPTAPLGSVSVRLSGRRWCSAIREGGGLGAAVRAGLAVEGRNWI